MTKIGKTKIYMLLKSYQRDKYIETTRKKTKIEKITIYIYSFIYNLIKDRK